MSYFAAASDVFKHLVVMKLRQKLRGQVALAAFMHSELTQQSAEWRR